MRPPKPLPAELIGRVFTRHEARRFGVSDGRLRARDIEQIARATYRHLSPVVGDNASTGGLRTGSAITSDSAQWEILRALCRRSAVVRVSHVTAALLHDLPVPRRLTETCVLHLTGRSSSHYSVLDPRVVLHRTADLPECSYRVHGVPVTAPPELFVELARYLSVTELVVLGDQLVRVPRAGLEPRSAAWCSVQEVELSVHQARGRLAVARAREALGLIRVGADSPPETLLRLALVAAGLPEPQLQIRLRPEDPFSPVGDGGYRKARIVLQYEGEYHFSAEQQARDQRRNAQFEFDGWTVVLVNRVDLREGFRQTVARVRALLKKS